MNKIWIVGAAGSGKSTLAKKLGERLDLPVHDLDTSAYVSKPGIGGKVKSLQDRYLLIEDITTTDRWVVEGLYIWWTKQLGEQADLIIHIDLPLWLVLWRIVKRHVQLSLKGQNKYKGIIRLVIFLGWVTRYHIKDKPDPKDEVEYVSPTRSTTVRFLRQFGDKVFVCKIPADVDLIGRI
jgi:adenylate kinase family enzyme